jgi:hypothetical protein
MELMKKTKKNSKETLVMEIKTGFIPDDRRRDPGNEVEPALGHASVSIFILCLGSDYKLFSFRVLS